MSKIVTYPVAEELKELVYGIGAGYVISPPKDIIASQIRPFLRKAFIDMEFMSVEEVETYMPEGGWDKGKKGVTSMVVREYLLKVFRVLGSNCRNNPDAAYQVELEEDVA